MNSGSRLTITAIKRKYAGGEKERGGYSRSIKIWLRSETRTMNEEKRKIERAMNIVLIKVRIKQSTQNTPNITAHIHTQTHTQQPFSFINSTQQLLPHWRILYLIHRMLEEDAVTREAGEERGYKWTWKIKPEGEGEGEG